MWTWIEERDESPCNRVARAVFDHLRRGIAGLTLGILLREHGWNPLLIERSPSPHSGGYMMDFFGTGWDVAERMNLTDALLRHSLSDRLLEIRR